MISLRKRGQSAIELTSDQYEKQRGNVGLSNLQVLDAILYVAGHGCRWRGLPAHFGNRHTPCTRMNRWSRKGVLDRVFGQLQRERMVHIRVEAYGLDSTGIKVQPDGTGARKKTVRSPSAGPGVDGTPGFIWLPGMPKRPLH